MPQILNSSAFQEISRNSAPEITALLKLLFPAISKSLTTSVLTVKLGALLSLHHVGFCNCVSYLIFGKQSHFIRFKTI